MLNYQKEILKLKNPIREITISEVGGFNNIFDTTEERIIALKHS